MSDAPATYHWADRLPDHLPATFGRYRLERLLGKGGMAAVFLATDTQLNRYVAVKIPRPETHKTPELRGRFLREARLAATLAHPNLCPVHDAGQVEGVYYLTMPYIEGRSLETYIRPGRRLPVKAVAAVVRQLARAMQEAHEKGIIHRDL